MAASGERTEIQSLDATERGRRALSPSGAFQFLPKLAGAVAACAALAACNAHDRGPTASVTPDATPAVATVSQTSTVVAGQPGAQPMTTQLAATAPAFPPVRPALASVTQPAAAPSAAMAAQVPAKAHPAARKVGRSGGGLASWYGDRFHGRPTANGERFDMGGFTAAHRTMPLPSYVRVTNVVNGRSIVVRVNDRGPFHGSRVIDVSRRTADVLGFRSSGVGNVKLDYVGPAPDDRSDDRKLLASYQEFGHATVPPGTQMASMKPVSDSELAAEAEGGTFAVASAAVSNSISAVRSSASAVASTAQAAVRTILPGGTPTPERPRSDVAVVASIDPATGAPTAYSAPQPLISAPDAIVAPKPAAKRVIRPVTEPVLASSTPELRPAIGAAPASPSQPQGVDVASRISAGFDSFASFATTVRSGASVSAEATR